MNILDHLKYAQQTVERAHVAIEAYKRGEDLGACIAHVALHSGYLTQEFEHEDSYSSPEDFPRAVNYNYDTPAGGIASRRVWLELSDGSTTREVPGWCKLVRGPEPWVGTHELGKQMLHQWNDNPDQRYAYGDLCDDALLWPPAKDFFWHRTGQGDDPVKVFLILQDDTNTFDEPAWYVLLPNQASDSEIHRHGERLRIRYNNNQAGQMRLGRLPNIPRE